MTDSVLFRKDRLSEIARMALQESRGDQAEVLIMHNASGLTRFANSTIHQNVFEEDFYITMRTVIGKKIGLSTTNRTDPESLRRLSERSFGIARSGEENPDFESLPEPGDPPEVVSGYSDATRDLTPAEKAESVSRLVKKAGTHGFQVAGAFSTEESELGVFNSMGVETYHPSTWSEFRATVSADDSQGFFAGCDPDVSKIEIDRIGDTAIQKCLMGRNPKEMSTGTYTVLLEPYAIAEVLGWMGFTGFGALPLLEKRGFMTGRLGEKIASERITLYDDGTDPSGRPLPFDFEGVPKKKTYLIERGVARGVVHDSITSRKLGVPNTGHRVPAESVRYGPLPFNFFMEPGDTPFARMIESMERGIWITRFHYVNGFLKPKEALMTGMTRGGTYYVEDGKVQYPVKNLRFTQSFLEALSNVRAVEDRAHLVSPEMYGVYKLPALLVEDFEFTGKTEY
jgi:predicted Zn-dependent protease